MIKAQIIRGPGVESEHLLHAVIINSEKKVIKEYGKSRFHVFTLKIALTFKPI